jgi:hypothetical protein
MRAVTSAAMAVLVVAALLAGNCLSCPQMLLAIASHQPAHGCCPHGKNQTPARDCTTQSLRHFVKADVGAQAAPAIITHNDLPPDLAPAHPFEVAAVFISAEHAPPAQLPIRI